MGPNGSNQVKTWSEETHLSLLVCVGPRNTVHLLYISCELVLKWWCFCGPIWELQKYLRTLWAKLSNIYKTQKRWKKDDVCLYLLLFKGVNQTSWCVPNFKLDSWGENTETFCVWHFVRVTNSPAYEQCFVNGRILIFSGTPNPDFKNPDPDLSVLFALI